MNKFIRNTMKMTAKGWLALAIIVLAGCATPRPTPQAVHTEPVLAENVYLANNIHAERRGGHLQASYANWTDTDRPDMIPVNTQVAIHDWPNGLAIRDLDDERLPVIMEYDQRRMGMSKQEYITRITSEQRIDLDRFSEIDRQGIENGEALIGMSKEGVRTALGYPASHETPSLEHNVWTYWRNRWVRYDVVFDDDEKVEAIRN